jgi:glycosyltransferase involved in cell wall biosynthesis
MHRRGKGQLRILHVVCSDNFAGVERYVVAAATEMAARDLDVTVVGGNRDRTPIELSGSKVSWLPGETLRKALPTIWRLGRFDVVHAHMFDAELALALCRPRVGSVMVCTRHIAKTRGSSRPARLVGRILTRSFPVQLAISQFVADRVEGKCVVVEPGVPCAEAPAPAVDRERIVLMVQRLEVEKQGEIGIEAFARSELAHQGWRLVIAGTGEDRKRLELAARNFCVGDSCEFLGAVSDVRSLYARAAVFVAPMPSEGFGLSVVEAMAFALPVVAARGGGHMETVGRVDGAALFPPGDARTAGALIADLASDPVRRQQYGDRLRVAQQQRFTLSRQVDKILEAYARLIDGRRG